MNDMNDGMDRASTAIRFVTCTLEQHGAAILDIFNDAIETSTALFDYVKRTPESMVRWFEQKQAGAYPVIGLEDDSGRLLGFASYGAFRAWPAYKYTIENAVYVRRGQRGEGLGACLLQRLVDEAIAQQYHLMVAVITSDNRPSIALHRKIGFQHAGTINQSGFKFGRWLDVDLYQLVLPTPAVPVDG